MVVTFIDDELPSGSRIEYLDEPKDADFGVVVKQALKEASAGKGSMIRDLMTNPITQAKALPYLSGVAGGLSGIPGGATAGTVGGRQLSNLALKTYGRSEEIPSATQQVVEAGTALVSDVIPFPALNKWVFGKQIGAAEKAAGVPPPEQIPSLPRPAGTESVSKAIDDAVSSVSSSGGKGLPQYWKQIKDQVSWIYERGKDMALSPMDRAKLQWLSGQVQNGLNAAVPGRAEPAKALARSQAIPNALSGIVRKTLGWAKIAIAGGLSGVGASRLMDALGSRR